MIRNPVERIKLPGPFIPPLLTGQFQSTFKLLRCEVKFLTDLVKGKGLKPRPGYTTAQWSTGLPHAVATFTVIIFSMPNVMQVAYEYLRQVAYEYHLSMVCNNPKFKPSLVFRFHPLDH